MADSTPALAPVPTPPPPPTRVIVLGITKTMRYGAPVPVPPPSHITVDTYPYTSIIRAFEQLTKDSLEAAVFKNGWLDCCLVLSRETADAMVAANIAEAADFSPYFEADLRPTDNLVRTRKGHIDMRVEYQDAESIAAAQQAAERAYAQLEADVAPVDADEAAPAESEAELEPAQR